MYTNRRLKSKSQESTLGASCLSGTRATWHLDAQQPASDPHTVVTVLIASYHNLRAQIATESSSLLFAFVEFIIRQSKMAAVKFYSVI